MKFSRRDFTKMILGAAALGLVEHSMAAKVVAESKRSMLWLSAQSASGEGFWTNLKVEGKLPKSLNGTLFRTAPGLSESFGTTLNHLFDGDAFLSAWHFEAEKFR
jgi:carotenoid cleavage dioxygenase-like enzyme